MFLSEQQQQHDWNNRDLSKADLYKTHLREWIVVGVDAHAAGRGYKTIPEEFGLHKSNQSDRWCSTMKERLTIKDHSHSKPCYSHQGHKGTVAGLSLSFLANVYVDDSTIRRTANGNRVHGTASRTERCSPEERTQLAQDHMDESQYCFNNIL